MRFFKSLTAALVVLAAVALVAPAYAQAPLGIERGSTGLPERGDQATVATGKLIDFSGGNSTTTTYDTFDFGFTSDMIRLCIHSGVPNIVYIRLANAVDNSATVLLASLASGGQRATAPISTSASFISGDLGGGSTMTRALPMSTALATPGSSSVNVGATGMNGIAKNCSEFPFRSPGLVTHVVSGLATIEAWAIKR